MGKATSDRAINIIQQGATNLIAHTRKLNRIKACLTEILPEPVNSHFDILNVRDGVLILMTDSPAWATRIRFLEPQLISSLAEKRMLKVRQIQVKIRLPVSPATLPTKQQPLDISLTAARILEQTAASIDHPALSRALQRLAAHAKQT